MNKNQVGYYLRRIYRLLRDDQSPIILRKFNSIKIDGVIHAVHGKAEETTIWLNPKGEMLSTVIHECLHVLYPKWSHPKIKKYEAQIFNQLTNRQLKNLLLRLALCVNEIDLD